MRDGDRDGFMATVSGSNDFRRRQRRLFDGLLSLPLASYDLTVAWERSGDLVRGSDRRRYEDADEVMIPLTEERYALAGIDEAPALEEIFYTYVRAGDEWRIADDDDLEDVGLYSARHLWDQGPVVVERRGRLLLIEHPCAGAGSNPHGCASIPESFLPTARVSLRAAEGGLPAAPMPDRVAILVPGTQRELARMIQATYELDNFLAFASSSVDVSKEVDFTGHRIVLNPSRILESSTPIETTLTHEFVHISTRELAGPFVPTFVDEGVAEYVARMDDANSLAPLEAAVDDGMFDRRLPKDHEFRTGGPRAIFLSYKESESAITFLIERWGRDAFVDFYRRLGGRHVTAGTSEFHVDRALRRTIGIGLERFERAWARAAAD